MNHQRRKEKSNVYLLSVPLLLALLLAGCGRVPVMAPTQEPAGATAAVIGEPSALYTPTPEPEIETPAWFDEAVLYEIFVRSFYDKDGDGIGDLAGITAKLDYLRELGATAMWLTPIHPSPSYHGYDVTDYFAVNPEFGTQDDMIALVQAAHERGMRVIMDLVVNHTSDKHPFFQDAWGNPGSKYADWYLWTNEDHTAYRTFGGYQHMPKLNHGNPEVVAYVLDIARFWLDLDDDGDYADGIDGFRCDVAKEVPLTTWQALRQEMRRLNADSFLLGEVWDTNARNLTKWYDDAFDALFDFPLYSGLAGNPDESLDSLLAGVQKPDMVTFTIIGEDKLFPSGYEIARFASNHDTNRVMSDVGGDPARARTAATMILTLPGTPMIYYGEEIGMRGEKGKGDPYWDEYRREPMDWYAAEAGPGMTTWFKPKDRNNAPGDGISVEEEASVATSLLSHYQALTALRHTHPALLNGAFAPAKVIEGEGVYAYTRHTPPTATSPEEWFLVILNFEGKAQQAALELGVAYPGPFAAVDALSGEAWPDVPAAQPYRLELAPASGVVLQLSKP
jgi:alpha-amylase